MVLAVVDQMLVHLFGDRVGVVLHAQLGDQRPTRTD